MKMRKGFTITELLVAIFIMTLGTFMILLGLTLSSKSYGRANTELKNSFNEFTLITTGIAGNEEVLENKLSEPILKMSLKDFLNIDLDEFKVIEVWQDSDGRKILILKEINF